MTNYRRGYTFERAVAADLTKDGYLCVRAGGSHGVADVVALKPGQVLLVQAKTDAAISIADWNKLFAVAEGVGAVPLLASRPQRGRVAYQRLVAPRQARKPWPTAAWKADEVN